MLEDYLLPQLERRQVPQQRVWFQQDGARPHTAAATLTHLQGAFPGKVLSKEGSVNWPPRSPDSAAVWGYLKAQVYRTPVRSLPILERRIRATIRSIPQRTLKAALDTVPLRPEPVFAAAAGTLKQQYFIDRCFNPLLGHFRFLCIIVNFTSICSNSFNQPGPYPTHNLQVCTIHTHTNLDPKGPPLVV